MLRALRPLARAVIPSDVRARLRHWVRGDIPVELEIESDLAEPFVVGRGGFYLLRGWCYSPARRVRSLEVLVDGVPHPVGQLGLARDDVVRDHALRDPLGRSLESGFIATIPFSPIGAPRRASLSVRAHFAGGRSVELPAGELTLVPDRLEPASLPEGVAAGQQPLVAIALATYKPALDLLEVQLESIRAQQHRDWICIINDDASPHATWERIQALASRDPRFLAFRNPARLGFYRNFEQALWRVPRDGRVKYVALSDQDDRWYPEKLSACLDAFSPDTQLVYCDMDLVTRDGSPIAHTYWTTRRNNYTDFETLLFANTVTGAASVFRADLLPEVLPFPERIGDSFHDHWIACTAMAKGRLGYVDRPLYAYRQHGANVLGHCVPETARLAPALSTIGRWARFTPQARAEARARLQFLEAVYQNDVQRIVLIARTLALRLPEMAASRLRVVRRLARIDRSLATLALEGVKYALGDRPSLGAEWYCLKGALGHRALRAYRRVAWRQVAARKRGGAGGEEAGQAPLEAIERKIAPLRLQVSRTAPRRVNLVIPTIDFRYFFGGYIAKFHLALMLRRQGLEVRVITVDHCSRDVATWREQIRAYRGLEEFFDQVEVVDAFDRGVPLEVNPADAFIATTWWTAHVAHAAVRDLGRERFVYLVQEYEPMTFPMGSYFALADESYTFPHHALFSTELLRDFFRERGLGVYREGTAAGDAHSTSFQNAINSFVVTDGSLRQNTGRRLLFYARPEPHASRNMFELGVLALRRAVGRGLLAGWEIDGIGSVGSRRPVELGGGLSLRLLPRTGLEEYLELLPRYDLGLALMLTPHPSLVPLDMAAAGLVTVTNTYGSKTAEKLRALSSNILGVSPTVEGVAQGIAEAVPRVADLDARLAGSRVAWATDWAQAFDDTFRERLRRFLGEA